MRCNLIRFIAAKCKRPLSTSLSFAKFVRGVLLRAELDYGKVKKFPEYAWYSLSGFSWTMFRRAYILFKVT